MFVYPITIVKMSINPNFLNKRYFMNSVVACKRKAMHACRPKLYSSAVCKLHFLLFITIMNIVDLTTAFPTFSNPLYFSSKGDTQILVNEKAINPFEVRTYFESYFISALPDISVSWYQNSTIIKSIKLQDASVPKFVKSPLKNATPSNFNTFYTQICLDNFIEERSDYHIKIASPYGKPIQSPPIIVDSHNFTNIHQYKNNGNDSGVSKFLKKKSGKKPIITIITHGRIAPTGSDVQLICRATGTPAPQVTWTIYDENTGENKLIEETTYIERMQNGDIIVKGDKKRTGFTLLGCEATNMFGSAYQESMLYYTKV